MLRRYMVAATLAALLMAVAATPAVAASPTGRSAQTHHHKAKRKGKHKKKKKATKKTGSLTVTGGTVTLTPNAATVAAFTQHKLTITALAPATLGANDVVTLPIASGKLNTGTGEGSLTLAGGYSYAETTIEVAGLFSGGESASFSNLTVVLGGYPALQATIEGTTGPFLALSGAKLVTSPGMVKLTNVPAVANYSSAKLLDNFAGAGTFKEGSAFGTLSVQATT